MTEEKDGQDVKTAAGEADAEDEVAAHLAAASAGCLGRRCGRRLFFEC